MIFNYGVKTTNVGQLIEIRTLYLVIVRRSSEQAPKAAD